MRTFLLFFLFLIITTLAVGHWLPKDYVIHKNIIISSTPSDIHQFVGDLERWKLWAPWNNKNSNTIVSISNKTRGIGANQSWKDEHGGGSLVFTSWSPDRGIEYDIYFNGGKYKSKASIKYTSISDARTKVSWTMHGDVNSPIIGSYLGYLLKYSKGSLLKKSLVKLKFNIEQNK